MVQSLGIGLHLLELLGVEVVETLLRVEERLLRCLRAELEKKLAVELLVVDLLGVVEFLDVDLLVVEFRDVDLLVVEFLDVDLLVVEFLDVDLLVVEFLDVALLVVEPLVVALLVV